MEVCRLISAKIIADSISEGDNRITTFELEYPRFIHGELMTHRLFSRNAMSSRAIPVVKMIEQVRNNPAMPVHWGKNQAGMQAKVELEGNDLIATKDDWMTAARCAADIAKRMDGYGAHKQIVNRLLEPFQIMKTVVTATEFDNFFWLRCHSDAQPEIKVLAERMYDLYKYSEPVGLSAGDWHTPYYSNGYWHPDSECDLETALKVSASCCAQVSFRATDGSQEKAEMIYDRLVSSVPVHASPFEHQASPIIFHIAKPLKGSINLYDFPSTWEDGVTHVDREASLWSGNLRGWIQYRQLIPDNVCNNYKEQHNETT